MTVLFLAVAIWLAGLVIVFGFFQRRTLVRLWREPMLRWPVVIFESDDWGPGPATDGDALDRLGGILGCHRDERGRRPVMTLGVLLAVADTAAMREAQGLRHVARLLTEPQFAPILGAMRRGIDSGVFSAQLHGMEHYWPDALLAAASTLPEVRAWLTRDGIPRTEDLPPPLQSRWVDASTLPARELPPEAIALAAASEVEQFARVFGVLPAVVVPPTFVWTAVVEAAWAKSGVKCIVTPGTRYSSRDSTGKLVGGDEHFCNGDIGIGGVMYIVRDNYFEPAFGHRAEQALTQIETKARAGRPALFETHRFNFVGPNISQADALREVDRLLAAAIRRFPRIRFMSTIDLVRTIAMVDRSLIETRLGHRLRIWFERSAQIPRLMKLAFATGAIVPAVVLYVGAGLIARMTSRSSTV